MGLDMFLFKRFVNEYGEMEDVEFGYWRKFWPLHGLITDIKYYELLVKMEVTTIIVLK